MGKPIKEGGKKDKESKKKASDASTLPEHLELQRTHVVCGTERNKHVSPTCHCSVPMHDPCSGQLHETGCMHWRAAAAASAPLETSNGAAWRIWVPCTPKLTCRFALPRTLPCRTLSIRPPVS